jgi:DNA-binding CsgD family transcriptional regulator
VNPMHWAETLPYELLPPLNASPSRVAAHQTALAAQDLGAFELMLLETLSEESRPTPVALHRVRRELLKGRFSVSEHFERDGRRYYVLSENDAHRPALSLRQTEILELFFQGNTNKSIAISLGLSPSSVATHLRRALKKLGGPSVETLVRVLSAGAPT